MWNGANFITLLRMAHNLKLYPFFLLYNIIFSISKPWLIMRTEAMEGETTEINVQRTRAVAFAKT